MQEVLRTGLHSEHAYKRPPLRPDRSMVLRNTGSACDLILLRHSRVVLQRPRPFRRANTMVGAAATAEGVWHAAATACCHWCAAR